MEGRLSITHLPIIAIFGKNPFFHGKHSVNLNFSNKYLAFFLTCRYNVVKK